MAIKENALPVSQSIGSGDYLRKVSSGGVSQQVPFSEVKSAVVTVDPAIDSESENPVQNKAIAAALDASGTQTQQAIATAIQTEVTDRNAAIASAIDDEETARNTAISEAVAAEAQAREAADEELNQSKANTDGNYPDMTVGNADQLISSIYTEDQTPYNFRQSGGGLSIGDREIDKIVGGTVAWNQLIGSLPATTTTNGITFTKNNDGSVTVNGTATADAVYDMTLSLRKVGKYLMQGCPSGGSVNTYYLGNISYSDTGNGYIANITSAPSGHGFRIYVKSGTTVNNLRFYPQIFCLTQMFGSTIADYIYSLEQATAGAGVAWFRKLFPKPYYAYNAGELMSVQAASHEMVGFNQWDEEWEVGRYDTSDGTPILSTTQIRCKNFVPVIPGADYYIKGTESTGLWIQFYDENKNILDSAVTDDRWGNTSGKSLLYKNRVMSLNSECHYIKFYLETSYGTTYNNDICINLSHNGSRNGEYEPYEKHSYELDSGLTLRGIPKLDASNNLYYDGDEYESDGSVNRRYGVVDLGTQNWSSYNDTFYANINGAKVPAYTAVANAICSKYPMVKMSDLDSLDKVIAINTGQSRVNAKDTAYTDAASFKAAMSGVMLVYELAAQTEESSAPYTNPQTVSDWGTEEYVDAAVQEGDRDVAVPVGHVTDYLANLRDKLQNLPDAAGADGTYLVQQTSGQMALLAYTPSVNIPSAPTTDGTYTLQAVVSGGVSTYSWVSS